MATKVKTKKTTEKNTPVKLIEKLEPSVMDQTEVIKQQPIRNRKNMWLFVASMVMIVMFLGWLGYQELVVATVDGKPIYRWEVVQTLEKQYGSDVLENMIRQKLIDEAAAAQGIQVSDEELASAVDEMRTQFATQGQSLDELVVAQGMTMADLASQLRTQLLVEKIAPAQETPTEDDIRSMMADQAASFPEDMTEEDQYNYVEKQLKQQAKTDAIQSWLDDLRTNSEVIYLKEY